ncbi:hypothetical protein MD484_g366, partial [Candolleomyces efflorescens]
MSNSRYSRIPNPSERHPHHDLDDEVEAAFDYREDDDDDRDPSESQPLNPNASQPAPRAQAPPPPPVNAPGTYNFEIVDYDYPPPGSPPPLSAHALPNEFGNSNGLVPEFDRDTVPQLRTPWWKRAATTVLPQSVANRIGISSARPTGHVGGGTGNDGVFANVTAKPTAPVRIQNENGDETYIVPEDTQQEAPPSYAAAQADAVPPYWETTIHAPFAPDSMGDMIVDSLPTGSLFSFCWNMLVSISFQFVGFLLTYLLHTSHAARLGSRAGLGVTLIQYGFALRGKLDDMDTSNAWSDWKPIPEPHPDFHTAAEAEAWIASHTNVTGTSMPTPDDQANALLADATAEWLSFFLMTIGASITAQILPSIIKSSLGWFILLTSALGFYRVKRWERSIMATQQRDSPAQASAMSTDNEPFIIHGMSRIEALRSGIFSGRRRHSGNDEERVVIRAELGQNGQSPTSQQLQEEARVTQSLRSAGFL